MHAHKLTKASAARAMAITMNDRGREEVLLLERWAASDSARTMDDSGWDDPADQFDLDSVAARPRHAFDA